jgi:haloacetate dehalogenase
VSRVAVLDIVPTYEAFRRADMRFGMAYWHWFFLAQPFDFPERLIGADPDYYFKRPGRGEVRSRAELFDPEALDDYLRCFRDPRTIHAICEDYRAAATIDYAIDEVDAGRHRIRSPLLALWSARGELERWYDVLAIWREWASDVRGRAIDAGHYLAEEAPDETYRELRAFLADAL